ncbi:MAG: nucleotidyltransferase family protein, partial [Thermodesulfobacteriota bacterium]
MKTATYSQPRKKESYLSLLHFARISGSNSNGNYSDDYKAAMVEALNAATSSSSPALRPLIPLIYHKTGQTGLRDIIQPQAKKILREKTVQLIGLEMFNQQRLKEIIASHKNERIPVILLKGAAFSGSLYPANAPRVGVDLDLLVMQDDFEAACKLLGQTMEPVLLSSERLATHDTLFERVFGP